MLGLLQTQGQLAMEDGHPRADQARHVTTGALPGRQGLRLRFDFVRFGDVFDGPTAFARWLESNGCHDFHYEFYRPDESDPNGF
jgi:hypothetical protein